MNLIKHRMMFNYRPLQRLTLLWLLLALGMAGRSQKLTPFNVVPPSPEVAAIAKYTDIPVGHATGAAQIGVPLYTVTAGNLSVPVSLSYNASGIRVEEAATWVGLGWNLNTGGSLTRVTRGLPDDGSNGYMSTIYKAKILDTMSIYNPVMWDIRYGQLDPTYNVDLEPDIFNFSAMGVSGKFYYSQDSGKFVLSPYQNVKIAYTSNSSGITSFTLTLSNGIKCYYGISQDQLRTSYEQMTAQYTTNLNDGVSSNSQVNSPAYISSWSLMDVTEPAGKKIQYYYTTATVNEFGRGGESLSYNSDIRYGVPIKNSSYFKNVYSKAVLQKITGDLADVYFMQSVQSRQDVSGDGHALDSVIVSTKAGKRIKGFLLDYGYFTSAGSTSLWGLTDFTEIARKRLYLKSVTELGDGSATLPPYRFTYNETPLPDRLSAAQDYWGYYNGKSNGLMLTPRLYYEVTGLPEGFISGSDRRVDTNYTQAGILTRIQYPTGGSSSYYYEANQSNILYLNAMNGIERSDLKERSVHFPRFLFADAPDTLYYADTFSVADAVTKIKINSQLGGCPAGLSDGSCRFHITIKGVTNPSFEHHITMTDVYYTAIPQGAYTITAVISPIPAGPVPAFSVDLNWSERLDANNWMVGGLRVRKIVSNDSAGNTLSKSFAYHFPGNPALSSGILAGVPTFSYMALDTNGSFLQKAVLSSSVVPLTNNGSIVRYQYVTEYLDSAWSTLKTEYSFLNDWRDPVSVKGNKVLVPLTQRDWQNGVLQSKKVYEKTATGYRLLTDEEHAYKEVQDAEFVYGVHYWNTPAGAKMLTSYNGCTQWFLPDSVTTTTYGYSGTQVTTQQQVSKNYYNDHYTVARVRTVNSRGQVTESKTWYPYDYDDVGDFVHSTLLQQYMLDLPVKQEASVNGKVTAGLITQYNQYGQPEKQYLYENPVFSDTVVHSRTALPETNYVQRRMIAYSGVNPIRLEEAGSRVSMFVWDYAEHYPTAEITNAGNGPVAYTSFEADGTGNWSIGSNSRSSLYAITGKNCYDLSAGSISKAVTSAATYIVSYWTRNGSAYTITGTQGSPQQGATINGWTLFKHTITGVVSVNISGTGYIDELRLYPQGAMMTTRTYEPAIGVTSICDARDQPGYFEYDGFNRLLRIRDKDNYILKQYDYQYQSPARFYNIAKTATATRNNCGVGAVASAATITIAAGTYMSSVSQDDADQQAQNAANAGAQAYANTNAACTWYNAVQSADFTRNNCEVGTAGTTVTYTIPAGTYSSLTSQEAADLQAITALNNGGQGYANSNGGCQQIYWNVAVSDYFTRSDCGTGYTGSTVTYTISAGTYSSVISQAAADLQATNALAAGGPAYANTNGTCSAVCSPACSTPAQKCISGVCRRGLKVYTACSSYGGGQYVHTFHYEYPDGTWSGDLQEIDSSACL